MLRGTSSNYILEFYLAACGKIKGLLMVILLCHPHGMMEYWRNGVVAVKT